MRTAIITQINAPVNVSRIGAEPCGYGRVLVKITMAGICGSQLQECRGEKAAEHIPHLMGHEGVGIVEEVGEGVKLKEGQRVCLHWRKGEGADIGGSKYYAEGIGNVGAGPIYTWATHCYVSENRCTVVPNDVPDEVIALLGCALSTALGVCENEARLRMGESVLVVGCGGVGLCCIAAAKAMGCEVWAHDKNMSSLTRAEALGARTDTLLEGSVDCSIDTTGSRNCINFACLVLKGGGRCILVGQPAPSQDVFLTNARHLFDGSGKRIIATQGGACNPSMDIPRWIRAWRSGHLKLDGIVTHRFPLAQVNEALDLLRSGSAGRIMLTMT